MNIRDAGLTFKSTLKYGNTPHVAYLHHRAGNGDMLSMHNYHLSLNWAGVGYHFYVRKDGSVWRGRPINAIPAGVSGHNTNTVHICAEGNYDVEKVMPDIQKNAIIELLKTLINQHPIREVKLHKDSGTTACPGKHFPASEILSAIGHNHTAQSMASVNSVNYMGAYPGTAFSLKSPTMKGEHVKNIQKRLTELGFDPGPIDGSFGPKTDSAVRAYQKSVGLGVDGSVGPLTWGKLSQGPGTNVVPSTNPAAQNTQNLEADLWGGGGRHSANSKHEPYFYANNKQMQRKGITIRIRYGKVGESKTIHEVFLRSAGQEMDASGNPIYNVYEFIGKDTD